MYNFLQLLVVTLPESYTARLRLYTEMSRVLKKFLDAGKSYFLRSSNREDKRLTVTIRELLSGANITSDGLAWQTCGLFVKPSASAAGGDTGGEGRKAVRMNRRNQRRRAKMERMEKRNKMNSSNSTSGDDNEDEEESTGGGVVTAEVNRDVGTGYTCGLWFLFHYVTGMYESIIVLLCLIMFLFFLCLVSSSSHSSQVTATSVMDGIYQLVAQFFSCDECRNHFIDHYTSCKFQRCEINAGNYELLQVNGFD